jgi:hypothetical protein
MDILQVERARRLRILMWLLYVCGSIVLVLGVLLFGLSGGEITASNQTPLLAITALLLTIVVGIGVARAGYIEIASHLLFLALAAADFVTSMPDGTTSPTLYGLFITIVGATYRPGPFWALALAALAFPFFDRKRVR